MTGFLTTIIGAFIGAGLAPFIINFFGERSKKPDKLREAYRLSDMVFDHFNLTYAWSHQLIILLKDKTQYSVAQQDFFQKNYPVTNPLQELEVLLDFDLGYQEDKMREFKSICVDMNILKANLGVRFYGQQYENIEDLEGENKKLMESIILSSNTIKLWCKTEKETTKTAYIVVDWCKEIKVKARKKLRQIFLWIKNIKD
jgi:hypothetical protein